MAKRLGAFLRKSLTNVKVTKTSIFLKIEDVTCLMLVYFLTYLAISVEAFRSHVTKFNKNVLLLSYCLENNEYAVVHQFR